jgi:hypothetical protein
MQNWVSGLVAMDGILNAIMRSINSSDEHAQDGLVVRYAGTGGSRRANREATDKGTVSRETTLAVPGWPDRAGCEDHARV